MIRGALLFLAVYLVAVGWRENGDELVSDIGDDISGFAPDGRVGDALMFLRTTPAKPVVNPIITLAVLTTCSLAGTIFLATRNALTKR